MDLSFSRCHKKTNYCIYVLVINIVYTLNTSKSRKSQFEGYSGVIKYADSEYCIDNNMR